VRCHAGASYPEHPTALFWEGVWLDVKEVVSEARLPKGKIWWVTADNPAEDYFMLSYEDSSAHWSIVPIPKPWDHQKKLQQKK